MTDITELKIVLLRNNMSFETLADKIGISRQSLSYKVNNKRLFTSKEIKNIKDTLGLNAEECEKIFFAK